MGKVVESDSDDDSEAEGEVFEIEKILKSKHEDGVKLFLVKWKNYPDTENTWEPIANLDNCPLLLKEFLAKEKIRKKEKKEEATSQSRKSVGKASISSSGVSLASTPSASRTATTPPVPASPPRNTDAATLPSGISMSKSLSVVSMMSSTLSVSSQPDTTSNTTTNGHRPADEAVAEPPMDVSQTEAKIRQPEAKTTQPQSEPVNGNSAQLLEAAPPKRRKEEHVSPFDKWEAEEILGGTDTYGQVMFLVKWKGDVAATLIQASEANERCPQLVIDFYEARLTWIDPMETSAS